jgi:rhomboid family GlyGly-CTERM serine protease
MTLHQASDAAGRSILRRSSAWRVPLTLAALSGLAAVPGSRAIEVLRYDRTDITAGELWRLITGHFAHLGVPHLILNLAGLAVVWLLVGDRYSSRNWSVVIVVSIAVIDLGFWFLDAGLAWYVGMSGLLHGVLVAGILSRSGSVPAESIALGVVIAGKIAYEQMVGPLPGSETSAGGAVVVNAHLYGAIAGIIAAGLLRIPAARQSTG